MNPNVEAWNYYRGEPLPEFAADALSRYRWTLDEVEAIPPSDGELRRAKLITLLRISRELQQIGTAALVSACFEAVGNGLSLRAVAREAGVSDVTILRWVNEINELDPEPASGSEAPAT